MEKDKTLLTLATAGIGLLATLPTTVGPGSKTELALYVLAGLAFGASVVAAVWIFDRNGTHIDNVLKNNPAEDTLLTWLDRILIASFLVGLASTAAIAFISGHAHLRKANTVTENKQGTVREQRSLNGIGRVGGTGASRNGVGKVGESGGSGQGGGQSGGGSTGSGGPARWPS